MKLGVYAQNQQDRFETAIETRGGTITWQRLYFTTQAAASMGLVSTRAAAGYKVYFSFTPNGTTWEQITAGLEDSRWTGIGNMLAAISNAGAWCFDPEPEDNRATFGSNANGTAFIAAFNRIAGIIKPLAPAWDASICFSDKLFPQWVVEYGSRGASWAGGLSPTAWWSEEADLLGFDYKAPRGWPASGTTWAANSAGYPDAFAAINEALSYAACTWNVPMCFPELATPTKNIATFPEDNAARAAWMQSIAEDFAGHEHIESAMYYEVNNQENAAQPNWSITDTDQPTLHEGTVSAFIALDGEATGYSDLYGDTYADVSSTTEYEAAAALSATAAITSDSVIRYEWSDPDSALTAGGTATYDRAAAISATSQIASASQIVRTRSVFVSGVAVIAVTPESVPGGAGEQPEFGIWEEILLPESVDATVRPESFRVTDFEPVGR